LSTPVFDPRRMVTSDAFSVSEGVLGLPLASGGRRLIAFALDGVLVALLALLGWRVLGLFLAFLFFRMATKRAPKPDPGLGIASRAAYGVGRGFRYSVGCLGGTILFATFLVGTGMIQGLFGGASTRTDGSEALSVVSGLVGAGLGARALRTAETVEDAEDAAVDLGESALALQPELTTREVMEVIEATLPDLDLDRPAFLERVERQIRGRVPLVAANPPVDSEDPVSLEVALATYRRTLGDTAAEPEALNEAAGRTIVLALAGDTLAAQADVIEQLEDDLRDERDAAEAARQEALEGRGLFARAVDTLDELGLTFGWGALYFATLLTWFQGRTPGKRVLGMRVIRLDGEPITLYIAFERAGGYAAGIATGLLGFAQIMWDPNRQAIHDKIAGTVVIREGLERLPVPSAEAS